MSATQTFPDNPVNTITLSLDKKSVIGMGAEFDDFAAKDDGTRFQVGATTVGPHAPGTIVATKDLGPGAQVQRLIDIEAIRQLTAEEIGILEAGGTLPPPYANVGGYAVPVTGKPSDYGPVNSNFGNLPSMVNRSSAQGVSAIGSIDRPQD